MEIYNDASRNETMSGTVDIGAEAVNTSCDSKSLEAMTSTIQLKDFIKGGNLEAIGILEATFSESASNASDTDVDDPRPIDRRKRKRKQIKPLWMRAPSVIMAGEVVPGPCATSAYNSLLRSQKLKFKYLTAKDLVDAIHVLEGLRGFKDGANFSPDIGSYVKRKLEDIDYYESVKIHVRVLNYLVNNINRNSRVGGKQLRMVRCKSGAIHCGLKWLAEQNDGLYILFGYLEKDKHIGHFAGYNAKLLTIYDSNTMATYNFCKDSVDIIFPGRLDCIHQLTFTDLAISVKRAKKSTGHATIEASIVDSAQI
jgi:hypothetical protein